MSEQETAAHLKCINKRKQKLAEKKQITV